MASARETFGNVLMELGRTDLRIVAMNADLSSSTKTSIFAKEFPERFFNTGVAEQNMMAIAAGLATTGKKVFASTFAVFATGRCYDQIRQSIAYPRLDVIIVATHGGITVSRAIGKLGYKGVETVEMTYVDHHLDAGSVLGGEEGIGHGLRFALSALELGRINIAARAVGVGQAAFDAAMRYSQERETFGKPIFEHQAIQFKLAEMATKLQAARLLTHDAARRHDAGERIDLEAGMAKLFAAEAAFEIATEAMRIHGGNGYSVEYPVERFFRDTPLMIIGEGTSEIQKLVIARKLLERHTAD